MANLNGLFTLGRDAESRQVGDSTVCNLALAYNYWQKGADQKPTQWIEAALWGRQAEALAPYLLKGKQVACSIEDPHIETYPKNDGSQGYKLVGRVVSIEMVRGGNLEQTGQPQRQAAPARQAATARQVPPPPAPNQASGFDDMDSEIPF